MEKNKNELCPGCGDIVFYEIDKDYYCEGCGEYFCDVCFQNFKRIDLINNKIAEGQEYDDVDFVWWCKECNKDIKS